MMKKAGQIILAFSILFLFGCTHSMRITNEAAFTPDSSVYIQPVKVGVYSIGGQPLLESAIEKLAVNPNISRLYKDYPRGFKAEPVDYTLDLSQTMQYRSSGENFIITFPGFIVFAHAIVGYKYYIDIDTRSVITGHSGKPLGEINIKTPYEIRYTSFGRGALSSLVGWFTPGWGALDIITGVVFANSYDYTATAEFIPVATASYKDFVSSKLLMQLAEASRNKTAGGFYHSYENAPVVIGDAETTADGNDRIYQVSVIKRNNDGSIVSQSDNVRELSVADKDALSAILAQGGEIQGEDVPEILASLGVQDIVDAAGTKTPDIGVYTLKDARIIPLYAKGIKNATAFAMKR